VDEAEGLELVICEDPNDSRRWTVFGDWLQRQGDPRGEAIGLWNQLREQVLPREERERLTARYRELCAPARWLEDLAEDLREVPQDATIWERSQGWPGNNPDALPPSLSELEWRHGFVLGATLRFASGDSAWVELLERFLALPCSRLLSRLAVSFLDPQDTETLLESGLLRRVHMLRFQHTPVSAWMPLVASRARLRRLDLDDFYSYGHAPPDERWVSDLAALPAVEGLSALCMTRTGLSAEGLQVLCSSPRLARLRTLELTDQDLGPAGAFALATSPLAPSLRNLTLSGCGLGDIGLVPLAESPALRTLQQLVLTHNHLGEPGAATLATSLLVGLTHLDLSHNALRDAGLQALLDSPVLSGLRVLRVAHNHLSLRTGTFRALPDRQVDYYGSVME
jgi:uncharacterized protein (TIGR02996 family)